MLWSGVNMIIKDNLFFDDQGRVLILRGVNLGGNSKCPFGPPGWGLTPDSLLNPAEVSFVGRPFPLEEAKENFHRLKSAGMTFLRLVITWEALEHAGPGLYDEDYIEYLRKILVIAEENGISVFIDPHQDVWSRWTGGDGAPAWTMEKLGMDLSLLDQCSAAVTKQHYSEFHKSKKYPNGAPYPKMVWPSNYNRYAAATMFSLFFAGKTFAPELFVDGENIQDWLQNHYIQAFYHAYSRLKNCKAIAGWGVINEPHYGFIGHKELYRSEAVMIPIGPRPSPFQAMCTASGYSTRVPVYGAMYMGSRITEYEIFNPDEISLFREGYSCPWKQAGVWEVRNGIPTLIKNEHFSMYQDRPVNFIEDFLKPFIVKFINKMKEVDNNVFFFIEGIPHSSKAASHPSWNKDDPGNTINAFHWYDGFSLFTKSFRPWFTVDPDTSKFVFGRKKVSAYFVQCLAKGIEWTKQKMGNMPCLLGEFGLAFDMNKRKAFSSGDYSLHEEALTMYYDAVDANLLHSTIWNYTADNTNKYGDGWNDEDLSVFSEGKERAAAGWKRPYPMATAGMPISFKYDRNQSTFQFRFYAAGGIVSPSIIYMPLGIFGSSARVEAHAVGSEQVLRYEYISAEQKLLIYNDGYSGEAEITTGRK